MNKFLASLLLTLGFISAQAAGVSPSDKTETQDAQALCIQQRIDICIKKLCQSNQDHNCVKNCEITVKNECRQAGE